MSRLMTRRKHLHQTASSVQAVRDAARKREDKLRDEIAELKQENAVLKERLEALGGNND